MGELSGAERRPTAGLRGASWDAAKIPAGMTTTVCPLTTTDGAQVLGYLHARGGEKAAVMIMHPRELLVSHYAVPGLVNAGYACWVQGPRTVGNDLRLEHEIALLDVAAGMVQLKALGFQKIVQLGNSGGAGLFAFYNQQSLLDPHRRIAATPAGRSVQIAGRHDARGRRFHFHSAASGSGKVAAQLHRSFGDGRERSVRNRSGIGSSGIRQRLCASPGDHAICSPIRRQVSCRAARARRTHRSHRQGIDRRSNGGKKPQQDESECRRCLRGAMNSIFQVWRTDADLRCFDLTLDPSDRRWGTVWGADPIASNMGAVGFARVCTPESWLSTWSGISSNASFDRCGSSLQQPVLMLYYTGDNTVFPSDAADIYANIKSTQKTRIDIRGNHHGHALKPGDPLAQDIAVSRAVGMARVRVWLSFVPSNAAGPRQIGHAHKGVGEEFGFRQSAFRHEVAQRRLDHDRRAAGINLPPRQILAGVHSDAMNESRGSRPIVLRQRPQKAPERIGSLRTSRPTAAPRPS